MAGADVGLVPEASLEEALVGARVVVSRAGYNSAYTLAKTDLPLVLVPSTWPEQQARAAYLSGLDGIWTLPEDGLEAGLRPLLEAALARGRAPRALPFRADGARRAAERLCYTL